MTEKERTTIAVSKGVHRDLSYEKLDSGYNSFEEMLVNEILNESG